MGYDSLKNNLVNALNSLGVTEGRTVFVQSELVPFMDAAKEVTPSGLPELILDSLSAAVGDKGTVVMPAFTTDCARKGLPFDLVRTKCDTGVLAEYLRCRPYAFRSLHPVLSVSALGYLAEYYTQNTSNGCYGWDTPFDRMVSGDTVVVRLGMPWNLSNTFSHYAEIRLNVPYLYNKVLDHIKVSIDGKSVKRKFSMTVRYLDFGITYNHTRQIKVVRESGFVKYAEWGGGTLNAINLGDYLGILKRQLIKDPFFLLDHPPAFRKGELPTDGIVIKNMVLEDSES